VADQEGSDSRSPGGGLSVGLEVLWIVSLFILAFMILYAVTTFILIGLSLYEAVEQKIERGATFEPPRRPLRPGISLIAPAYKMDQVIVPSVISLLASDYDPLEVVIVDDGSTDGTLERMIVAFDLVDLPVGDRFQLETEQVERSPVHLACRPAPVCGLQAEGARSDAINAGINLARQDWLRPPMRTRSWTEMRSRVSSKCSSPTLSGLSVRAERSGSPTGASSRRRGCRGARARTGRRLHKSASTFARSSERE
jgi:Glycosyl transferase family 2